MSDAKKQPNFTMNMASVSNVCKAEFVEGSQR